MVVIVAIFMDRICQRECRIAYVLGFEVVVFLGSSFGLPLWKDGF
jgi:hypothetical protein